MKRYRLFGENCADGMNLWRRRTDGLRMYCGKHASLKYNSVRAEPVEVHFTLLTRSNQI